MLSQLDPTLVKQTDEIAVRGGPVAAPPSKFNITAHPRFAPPPVARTSARLRGVQPNVDVHNSPEIRRARRGSEGARMEKGAMANGEIGDGLDSQGLPEAEGVVSKEGGAEEPASQVEETGEAMEVDRGEPAAVPVEPPQIGTDVVEEQARNELGEAGVEAGEEAAPSGSGKAAGDADVEVEEKQPEVTPEMRTEYVRRVAEIKVALISRTVQLTVDRLEGVNACLCRLVHNYRRSVDRTPLLEALSMFVGEDNNFHDDEQ